jgi:hypothetical protein
MRAFLSTGMTIEDRWTDGFVAENKDRDHDVRAAVREATAILAKVSPESIGEWVGEAFPLSYVGQRGWMLFPEGYGDVMPYSVHEIEAFDACEIMAESLGAFVESF